MNWIPDLVSGLRDISIVVFLGYGLRLMKQQNELLEREKALKQSEIDVHRANIERLQSLQAPAIARDLEQMARTANEYAEKKRELEQQLVTQAQESQAAEALAEMSNTVGIAAGSLEALALLSRTRDMFGMYFVLAGRSIEDNFVLRSLDENIRHISATAEQALHGQKPELKEMKMWLEEVAKRRTSPK